MATFNTLGATPASDGLGGLNATAQGLGIDAFDQELNFDDSLLDGVHVSGLPFTPSYDFETFSTTFEDPFSYQTSTRQYDHAHTHAPGGTGADADHGFPGEASSPQELDNKLLGFGALISKASVVDEVTAAFTEVSMTAELYGMFFVAEDVFGGENTAARPLELTCYRRNLWQCSGQITLPRHISHVVDEQGRQVPLFELSASITAIESIEGKTTEIISIPWKSSNPALGNGGADEGAKVAAAPPQIPLDLSAGQELDGNRVSVPVSWKRLQFKHATANNGRRKGLQQHYVVQINLLGKAKSGEWLKICEIQSGPVIVRGRSPRNFDSRKDVPLTGDKRLERRNTDASGGSGGGREGSVAAGGTPIKGDLAQNIQRYHSLGNVQVCFHCPPEPDSPGTPIRTPTTTQQSSDWTTQPYSSSPHPSKKLALSPNQNRPPVPAWGTAPDGGAGPSTNPSKHAAALAKSINQQQQRAGATTQTLPISLSLSEDERSPNRSGSDSLASPQFSKSMMAGSAGGQNSTGSPAETADMLYEYFPLSLDDW
ncbi:p53-like transcription factor [Thozetella sp. PMI_491]|nr:p53-like transcription factor [Thozetella sp. PMI_491]